MCSTRSFRLSTSTVSPTSGTWPRVPNIRPPTVSQSSSGRAAPTSVLSWVHRHAPVDQGLPARQRLQQRLGPVELVDNLADQLLDEVFERDEPGRASVLVDHHGQVAAGGAHLLEQLVDSLRLGDEHRPAHRFSRTGRSPPPERSVRARSFNSTTPTTSSMSSRQTGSRLSPRAMATSSAAVTVASRVHGHHVGSGCHDLAHNGSVQGQGRRDHVALGVLDGVCLGRGVGQGDQLVLADGRRAGAAPHRQEAPAPALGRSQSPRALGRGRVGCRAAVSGRPPARPFVGGLRAVHGCQW